MVAEAADGREAIEAIRRERPDVALVDYQMPDVDGAAVVRAVVREELPTRVLLLSAHTDSAIVFDALQEGAAGYLGKEARRSEIVEAVLKAARGETVVPADVASGLAGEIRMRAQPARRRCRRGSARCCRRSPRGRSIPQVAAELIDRGEHGEDPHPAALREARRLRPGRGRRRGDAPGPVGVGPPAHHLCPPPGDQG